MDDDTVSTGGCLCGAIRFTARGKPFWVAHCHCHSCRRNTGSAVATFVGFSKDQHAYSQGAPASYNSSPGVTRSFCQACGTPLTYEGEWCPGEVHVYISTLDNPEDFEPQLHVFFAEKIPWFDTADHLPRFEKTSRDDVKPPG